MLASQQKRKSTAHSRTHWAHPTADPQAPSQSDKFWQELNTLLRKQSAETPIAYAIYEFMRDVKRRSLKDATEAKYRLTLERLLRWCATQLPPISLLAELDVCTLRTWLRTLEGTPITRHHAHERMITFLHFCREQGWVGDNVATRIRNVNICDTEPVPFSVEQYDALLAATHDEGAAAEGTTGSLQSRRIRAFIKLLRWSGLRVGDAACLPRSQLRGDSLQLNGYQHGLTPFKILLPRDTVNELRGVPRGRSTDPRYFFWSGRSKRKSEVATWERRFAKVVSRAAQMCPQLFRDANGQSKPAYLSMLRHTFAVEYLLAGMPIDEVSLLLGHAGVLRTRRLYAAWFLPPQQELAAKQRAAWATMSR